MKRKIETRKIVRYAFEMMMMDDGNDDGEDRAFGGAKGRIRRTAKEGTRSREQLDVLARSLVRSTRRRHIYTARVIYHHDELPP